MLQPQTVFLVLVKEPLPSRDSACPHGFTRSNAGKIFGPANGAWPVQAPLEPARPQRDCIPTAHHHQARCDGSESPSDEKSPEALAVGQYVQAAAGVAVPLGRCQAP
eukprot:jgi/Tetstr1/459598/TSEL_004961.t1